MVLLFSGLLIYSYLSKSSNINTISPKQVSNENNSQLPNSSTPLSTPVETIATNLDTPWSLAFLPDGNIILTERPGNIKLIGKNRDSKTILTLDDTAQVGESGLLGITLHPQFTLTKFVYVYQTYSSEESLQNRVIRFRLDGETLKDRKVLLDNIPVAENHNGGRIKFGPDGYLYITTGDASNPSSAQNRTSLAGKILRIIDDGSIPEDNPNVNSPVFSYGHRNPQGLAWDNNGTLWATEHGPSARDELNLIKPGNNYGWPTITGDTSQTGLQTPVLNSGADTWAPSGLIFYDNSLYFVGLRGQSIYKVENPNINPTLKQYFKNDFGRIRDIVIGPDKTFYILTNNTDGRGTPGNDDDKIIRLNPNVFQ